MKGLADQAMSMKAKPKEEAGPDDEKPSELGIVLDELFSLKGKDREAAFKAAVSLCQSSDYGDEE